MNKMTPPLLGKEILKETIEPPKVAEILPNKIPTIPISEEIKIQSLDNATLINPTIIGGSTTGTDTTQDVSRPVTILLIASDTSCAVADGKYGIAIPTTLNGYVLTEALASVYTKGATGSMTIQIRRYRAGASADMLTTKITLGDVYSATSTDVSAYDDIATGDLIYVDVDTIHTTAAKGLTVTLTFNKIV